MRLRIFTEPQQGASYSDLLAVAQLAEQLGFDAFFRSDHYQAIGAVTGLPGPTDAWMTLSAMLGATAALMRCHSEGGGASGSVMSRAIVSGVIEALRDAFQAPIEVPVRHHHSIPVFLPAAQQARTGDGFRRALRV
jgi:hypothetical protein